LSGALSPAGATAAPNLAGLSGQRGRGQGRDEEEHHRRRVRQCLCPGAANRTESRFAEIWPGGGYPSRA
jgi:hypothetical protein